MAGGQPLATSLQYEESKIGTNSRHNGGRALSVWFQGRGTNSIEMKVIREQSSQGFILSPNFLSQFMDSPLTG